MNEAQARTAMTFEHTPGHWYMEGGKRVWQPALWDLRTPDGWCWETDRHLNVCYSLKEVASERKNGPIEPCTPECMVCGPEENA